MDQLFARFCIAAGTTHYTCTAMIAFQRDHELLKSTEPGLQTIFGCTFAPHQTARRINSNYGRKSYHGCRWQTTGTQPPHYPVY